MGKIIGIEAQLMGRDGATGEISKDVKYNGVKSLNIGSLKG